MARNLGIGNSVMVNHPTGDFRKELESSAVYMMTLLYEGFPMVLVEAAAAGTPAIAFNCPTGPAEAILDGETGFIIAQRDIAWMSSGLRRLMSDRELRERMGEKAREHSSVFDIDKIMSQWMNLFRELTGE